MRWKRHSLSSVGLFCVRVTTRFSCLLLALALAVGCPGFPTVRFGQSGRQCRIGEIGILLGDCSQSLLVLFFQHSNAIFKSFEKGLIVIHEEVKSPLEFD
jgi:hypothetical protein